MLLNANDDKRSFSGVPLFFCSVPPPLFCLFLGIGCSLTLRATFSHTLDKIGNKEIGLLFPGSSKSPSFKIGDTSRIRQVLVVKEEFIIAAIYRRNNYNYRYKVLDDTSWYLVKT